ncbi:MAG: hypothetical protein KJ970_10035 [Candidatus Eisenbacteria bacterium]|uniref:P/Homo B domain-containing protein n=1 Tax=Eiseniibacteriota bacterium TaxID=2212470 RepID=A0A948RXB3_UNCEI|nr:hypothetical protein [Candidatus Eisenbacteria bacterium]MBU2691258.1 hypothetical protein [Candidatus Eisenbacteria bacterium]
MNIIRTVILFTFSLFLLPMPIYANPLDGETCNNAILIDVPGYETTYQLDTREYANDIDSLAHACTSVIATGPDIVFRIQAAEHGSSVAINWSGDFEACVYGIELDCENPCSFGGTGENIHWGFVTGEYNGDPGGSWNVYLVVDGVDGASGTGTLNVFTDQANPASEDSWGKIKSLYEH